MNWPAIAAVAAGLALVGYIAWGIARLNAIDWTDVNDDLGEYEDLGE